MEIGNEIRNRKSNNEKGKVDECMWEEKYIIGKRKDRKQFRLLVWFSLSLFYSLKFLYFYAIPFYFFNSPSQWSGWNLNWTCFIGVHTPGFLFRFYSRLQKLEYVPIFVRRIWQTETVFVYKSKDMRWWWYISLSYITTYDLH